MPGITDITLVRELGQPSLTIEPDRAKIAQYGLNVADINTLIETAVGGTPATQVIQGERSFDLVVRLQEPFRQNMDAIKNLLIATPDGQHLPLSQFADIKISKGASFIYRESNSRFIGIQFSVGGTRSGERGAGRAAPESQTAVPLPIGYTYDWGGEYKEYLAAQVADDGHHPDDGRADPADPVRALRQPEVPADHHVQRAGHRAGGRAARAEAHRHATSACRRASASSR